MDMIGKEARPHRSMNSKKTGPFGASKSPQNRKSFIVASLRKAFKSKKSSSPISPRRMSSPSFGARGSSDRFGVGGIYRKPYTDRIGNGHGGFLSRTHFKPRSVHSPRSRTEQGKDLKEKDGMFSRKMSMPTVLGSRSRSKRGSRMRQNQKIRGNPLVFLSNQSQTSPTATTDSDTSENYSKDYDTRTFSGDSIQGSVVEVPRGRGSLVAVERIVSELDTVSTARKQVAEEVSAQGQTEDKNKNDYCKDEACRLEPGEEKDDELPSFADTKVPEDVSSVKHRRNSLVISDVPQGTVPTEDMSKPEDEDRLSEEFSEFRIAEDKEEEPDPTNIDTGDIPKFTIPSTKVPSARNSDRSIPTHRASGRAKEDKIKDIKEDKKNTNEDKNQNLEEDANAKDDKNQGIEEDKNAQEKSMEASESSTEIRNKNCSPREKVMPNVDPQIPPHMKSLERSEDDVEGVIASDVKPRVPPKFEKQNPNTLLLRTLANLSFGIGGSTVPNNLLTHGVNSTCIAGDVREIGSIASFSETMGPSMNVTDSVAFPSFHEISLSPRRRSSSGKKSIVQRTLPTQKKRPFIYNYICCSSYCCSLEPLQQIEEKGKEEDNNIHNMSTAKTLPVLSSSHIPRQNSRRGLPGKKQYSSRSASRVEISLSREIMS